LKIITVRIPFSPAVGVHSKEEALKLRICVAAALLAACAVPAAVYAQAAEGVTVEPSPTTTAVTETPAQRDARMAWWREAKFGLFIHWGVYAVPAGVWGEKNNYGEWIMHSAKIPSATYKDLAKKFNPVKYSPDAWTDMAKNAGMKYIVITSKHHDGFALFPSKASKWNVVDATPYGKDLLAPLVTAAHSKGLKIGFYYSQAQDWNNVGGAKSRFTEPEGWDPAVKGSFDDYLKNVAVPQVRELLTNYPIDILWWDTPTWMNKDRAAPLAALLSLRPNIITNNRLGSGFKGDTETPEQFVPATGYPGDWETCMTMNGHWGYNAADKNFKSTTDLIRKLADICSKGGNFLLNVGPTAEGEFPPESVDRLREIGEWMKVNSDSIYGTGRSPFAFLTWGCATSKNDGKRLYLHVFDWPADGKLRVPAAGVSPGSATASLLASPGVPLKVTPEANRLVIDVPTAAPNPHDSVIVLNLPSAPVAPPSITLGATVTASATDAGSSPAFIFDGSSAKRWRAGKDVKSATLDITLKAPSEIAAFAIDEPDVWPRMKQKLKLEAKVGDEWKTLADLTTNGHGVRNVLKSPVTAQNLRITLSCEEGNPGIAELSLFSPE
jgi:alpha-L-fucosidase